MTQARPLELSPTSPDGLVRPTFERLSSAWRQRQGLTYPERMALLDKLHDATKRWEERLATAIDEDFGSRSKIETALAEVFITLASIKYIKRHLKSWMRPEARETSWVFMPAKNRIIYQPRGVVGVIAPWNYPLQLALVPIAYAIAAGNRVLLKPSELTPKTSDTLAAMLAEVFPSDTCAVITGGPEVGIAFSKLPFDHLLFTGSTTVGRHVMRAAADNLVPVTLELGGKSPVIVHGDYPLEKAAERVANGKLLNAGQTCIAPDYVLVPKGREEAFAAAFSAAVARFYPTLADNPDYTSIISDRHYQRLARLRDEARDQGAKVVEANPANETLDPAKRKLAPTLLLNVPEGCEVMADEIFGPLLPVVGYERLEDAIDYVNDRPRPLALYYFDRDDARIKKVLSETTSGGACVNETLLHVGQDDLPFGGVGPSGMGAYHGREGFLTFSHAKAVFHQSRLNSTALLAPPYGSTIERLLGLLIGKAKRR
ncbi:MAG TPA: coniferyl aldehyde dehydrogenase [Myxococcota bacterium]|nr:coniferyl aldehyde dehydrogenase [Myxococcota bacterium]